MESKESDSRLASVSKDTEEPGHLKNGRLTSVSKDTEERLRQTIVILRKLTQDLGLPYDSEEVQTVKGRLYDFVKTGDTWKGSIPFTAWDRIAVLEMANNKIELTLKAMRKR